MTENFWLAVAQIFAPGNLFFLIFGGIAGIVVGCLPGLTATMALALLVPFTFTMPAVTGLIMLGGLYVGAMFGDAIPATLINTPGTPSAIATTFDGYPLAKKGMAQQALITNAVSSLFGGIFGAIALLTLSPPLAEMGLKFGPPEYFWIAIFGLTIIGTLASKSVLKGLAAGALGLLLSTIGISPLAGDVRFTFGVPSLQAGLDLTVALIGFFCIPQVLEMVEEGTKQYRVFRYQSKKGLFLQVFNYLIRKPFLMIRSALIGLIVGIMPGVGGNVAGLLSYNEAVRWSKNKAAFGKGTLDGVAATETANCSVVQGSIIPMLTLGIPGSPAAAVILGALLLHGMRPGPELFTKYGGVTYTFILSFFVAVVVMFVLTVLGSRFFAKMISVPLEYLLPLIAFLSIIGSFAIRNSLLDVGMMLFLGTLAHFMQKLGLQSGPLVLGLIMGPFAEQGLVQSLLMGQAAGSVLKVMFGRPISLVLIGLSLLSIVGPLVTAWRKRSAAAYRTAQASSACGVSAEGEVSLKIKGEKTMNNTDLITGLIVLGISGAAFFQSHAFTFYGRVFVDWTLIILTVLGGLLVVKGLLSGGRIKTVAGIKRIGAVGFAILGLFIYLMLIPVLGFIITSIVGFTLSGVLLSPGSDRKHIATWLKAFGVGLLMTVIFYVLFKLALAVPLPGGVLGIG